jgi:hypothetical protein
VNGDYEAQTRDLSLNIEALGPWICVSLNILLSESADEGEGRT